MVTSTDPTMPYTQCNIVTQLISRLDILIENNIDIINNDPLGNIITQYTNFLNMICNCSLSPVPIPKEYLSNCMSNDCSSCRKKTCDIFNRNSNPYFFSVKEEQQFDLFNKNSICQCYTDLCYDKNYKDNKSNEHNKLKYIPCRCRQCFTPQQSIRKFEKLMKILQKQNTITAKLNNEVSNLTDTCMVIPTITTSLSKIITFNEANFGNIGKNLNNIIITCCSI